MPNQAKVDQVSDITAKFEQAKSCALIQYQGLNAIDISTLRDNVRANGGRIEVVKNSLITRALANLGITLPETLVGPTAITFCNEDEVGPLKEVDKVNKTQLGFDELKQFLALPSKSTLITQLLGGLVNPLQRLTYSMRYNQNQLALALKAVVDKQEQN
jgi:large subunit ribosomal protein L10